MIDRCKSVMTTDAENQYTIDCTQRADCTTYSGIGRHPRWRRLTLFSCTEPGPDTDSFTSTSRRATGQGVAHATDHGQPPRASTVSVPISLFHGFISSGVQFAPQKMAPHYTQVTERQTCVYFYTGTFFINNVYSHNLNSLKSRHLNIIIIFFHIRYEYINLLWFCYLPDLIASFCIFNVLIWNICFLKLSFYSNSVYNLLQLRSSLTGGIFISIMIVTNMFKVGIILIWLQIMVYTQNLNRITR